MGLFSWLFHSAPRPSPQALAPITLREDGNFVDVTLPLQAHHRAEDEAQRFVAGGTYYALPVGFAVVLPAEWQEGTIGHGVVTYMAWCRFESLGKESDQWLATLRKLYQLPELTAEMLPAVTFTAITLEGDPRRPECGPVKIKLFYECDAADPAYDEKYAEHYLNLDLVEGKIEFHEKDPEYRSALLSALTASPGEP